MTIKRRFLLFGFGTAILFLAGILGVLAGTTMMKNRFRELQDHASTTKIQTLIIGREVNFVSRLTRNIMLGSNFQKDMGALDETIAKIDKAFITLQGAVDSDEDRTAVAKAKEATLAFVHDGRSRMRALEGTAPEKRPATFKDYETYATPLAMKSREAFDAIIKRADQGFSDGVANYERQLNRFLLLISLGGTGAIIFVAIAFLTLNGFIQRPINHLIATLKGIRSSWDLTQRLDVSSADEMGDIAREVNAFLDALHEVLGTVRTSSERVASGSLELSATAKEVSRAAEEIARFSEAQRLSAKQTAAAMDEFGVSNRQVTAHAEASIERSRTMLQAAEEGAQQGRATVAAMASIRGSTAQMLKAVQVIQELARQTNLLSLNAAIEAAKAGTQGKGFAVVAEEVRKLAENSSQAARQIGTFIAETEQAILEGTLTVEATGKTLDSFLQNLQAVATASREIGEAAKEQGVHSTDVARQVDASFQATERGAAASMELSQTVHEVDRTTQELSEVAENLSATLTRFKVRA